MEKTLESFDLPRTFGLQPLRLSGANPITENEIKSLLTGDVSLVAVASHPAIKNYRAYASKSLHDFCSLRGQADNKRLVGLGFTVVAHCFADMEQLVVKQHTYEEIREINREP